MGDSVKLNTGGKDFGKDFGSAGGKDATKVIAVCPDVLYDG